MAASLSAAREAMNSGVSVVSGTNHFSPITQGVLLREQCLTERHVFCIEICRTGVKPESGVAQTFVQIDRIGFVDVSGARTSGNAVIGIDSEHREITSCGKW